MHVGLIFSVPKKKIYIYFRYAHSYNICDFLQGLCSPRQFHCGTNQFSILTLLSSYCKSMLLRLSEPELTRVLYTVLFFTQSQQICLVSAVISLTQNIPGIYTNSHQFLPQTLLPHLITQKPHCLIPYNPPNTYIP